MVKFEGDNGIKLANLLAAIRERYNITYKQSVNYFIRAVTDKSVMDEIERVIDARLEDK